MYPNFWRGKNPTGRRVPPHPALDAEDDEDGPALPDLDVIEPLYFDGQGHIQDSPRRLTPARE